jgi:hypothetical protein
MNTGEGSPAALQGRELEEAVPESFQKQVACASLLVAVFTLRPWLDIKQSAGICQSVWRSTERLQEPLPIRVVVENRLPPISPAQYMIDRTGILHPRFARHAAYPGRGSEGTVKPDFPIAGTDRH